MVQAVFHVELNDDPKNFRLIQNGLGEIYWQHLFEGTWLDLRTEAGGGRGLAVKKFGLADEAVEWMKTRRAEHAEYLKQSQAMRSITVLREGA